ncbi:MAG: SusC/RagA family TonB-linked outer membrane protein [Bacteroidota bacterium]
MTTLQRCYCKTYLCFLALLLGCSVVWAQDQNISGTIRDETGTAIEGATVLVQGETRGTISDQNGQFQISVNTGDQLVINFYGYRSQTVPVKDQSSLELVLIQDLLELDAVVVTALGVEKEVRSLGYSVTEFQGENMVKARESNPISTLTGKVAGLSIQTSTDFFQDPSITMRGGTPLIVIDGVPNPNADFWEISPDDIDNISVLKGATASALFGSIGRNGALMITTKRGRNQLSIEINSSNQFQTGFLKVPQIQTEYGTGDQGEYVYVDGFEYSGYVWGPKLNQSANTPSGFWETPQYNSPLDPNTGERMPTPFINKGVDNMKTFFRTGLIQSNNISITGGNDEGNFRMSVSNSYQRGQVPNTDLNILGLTVSGGYNLSDKVSIDASLNYGRQESENYPNLGYGSQSYLYSIMWLGANIDLAELENYWEEGQEGFQQRQYNKQWFNNPYFMAHEYNRAWFRNSSYGQTGLTYNITEGLKLKVKSGFSYYSVLATEKEPKSYIRGFNDYSDGNYFITNQSNFNINTDAVLSYSKDFSDRFGIHANAGGSVRNAQYLQSGVFTDGLIVPGYYNIANSANPIVGENRETRELVQSVYGTLDMEVLGSIFIGFTGRNDWVSTLPLENNSFFYPSASLSVVLSDLMKLPESFSFLKLRSSWAQVSDGSISNGGGLVNQPYNHIGAYNQGTSWNNVNSVNFPSIRINPDLKPETSNTWEVGLDARFFKGRLNLDVAYYNILDFNNLISVPVTQASGFSARLENGGEFRRRGVEMLLSGSPVKTKNFQWTISTNWTQYRRYLQKAFDESGELNNIQEGHRTDEIWDVVFQKSPGGQYIIENGTRVPDPFIRMIGHDDADWIYGLQQQFRYKNVSLGISGDGRLGGLIYSITNFEMHWAGTHPNTVRPERDDANAGIASYIDPGLVVVEGRATTDLDGNIVSDSRVFAPNTQAVNYISWAKDIYQKNEAGEDFYFDESFFKIREIILTYHLPAKWMNRNFLKSASLSFVGRNMYLLTSVPQIDPDQGFDDQFQSPSSRNFGFNLNLKF